MSKVRKLLLRDGVYAAPQGQLVAGRDRMLRWVDTFRKMKGSGIRIPLCWGHQPEALPCDDNDRAAKQFYLSRFNAGYLDSLEYDPATGRMDFGADAPGCEVDDRGNLVTWTRLPDGREVKSAVGEVSAAIRDWTDGTALALARVAGALSPAGPAASCRRIGEILRELEAQGDA